MYIHEICTRTDAAFLVNPPINPGFLFSLNSVIADGAEISFGNTVTTALLVYT